MLYHAFMEPLPPPIAAAIAVLRCLLEARFGERLTAFRLFGSWAWGLPHAESDVDLCIVVDGLTHRQHVEIMELAADRAIERDLDLSPMVWSSERFQRGFEVEQRLVGDIVEKGLSL